MTNRRLFQTLTLALVIVLMLALGACTGTPAGEPSASDLPTATPTTTPDEPVSSDDATDTAEPAADEPQDEPEPGNTGEMIIKDAKILSVDIAIMESWPLQASAQVHGELGDGCTELDTIETEREGDQFNITITTARPGDAVCTMILRTFDETIPLDIAGLEAGTYVVNVNGVEQSFTLEKDNVMEPEGEQPEDSADAAELSAEDRAQIVRLTLEKALVDQEIPDYNLLDDPQNVVLSTENISAELVPDLEGITFELLTPEEIQARANEQGDFLYLRFDELSAQSPDKVTVSLSNAWAIAEDSDQAYLSGGGFNVEYTRKDQGWVGEVTSIWIS